MVVIVAASILRRRLWRRRGGLLMYIEAFLINGNGTRALGIIISAGKYRGFQFAESAVASL